MTALVGFMVGQRDPVSVRSRPKRQCDTSAHFRVIPAHPPGCQIAFGRSSLRYVGPLPMIPWAAAPLLREG
jgi:hypothetical protein